MSNTFFFIVHFYSQQKECSEARDTNCRLWRLSAYTLDTLNSKFLLVDLHPGINDDIQQNDKKVSIVESPGGGFPGGGGGGFNVEEEEFEPTSVSNGNLTAIKNPRDTQQATTLDPSDVSVGTDIDQINGTKTVVTETVKETNTQEDHNGGFLSDGIDNQVSWFFSNIHCVRAFLKFFQRTLGILITLKAFNHVSKSNYISSNQKEFVFCICLTFKKS